MPVLNLNHFSIEWDGRGTAVCLDNLQPGVSIGVVQQVLRNNKILQGVNWDIIEQAVAAANSAGKTVSNIRAAVAPFLHTNFKFGTGANVSIASSFWELNKELETFSSSLGNGSATSCPNPGIFVLEGELFLSIVKPESFVNVFGNELDSDQYEIFFPVDETITVRNTETHFEYYSKNKGYILRNAEGRLNVSDPVIVPPDKMLMTFILAPVKSGMEEILNHFYDKLQSCQSEQSADSVIPERSNIRNILDSGNIIRKPIKKGLPAIAGKDAFIDIKFKQAIKRQFLQEDRVDYKNFTPYVEVSKNQVLVEKFLANHGRNGHDVFGNLIIVEPGKDLPFQAGEGVAVKADINCAQYISKLDGVVTIGENSIKVSEDLKIKGDVSPETGNLKYSRKISIHGSVRSGYSIKGGSDIAIKKHVENGALVNCSGNLFINSGILGERTEVFVKGDAEIGFIENAKVVVEGDLLVHNYIFKGRVFCKGQLLVKGQQLKTDHTGAVIGSLINSMKSMHLHSAGSYANQTDLICGVHLEKLEILKKSETLVNLITQKLVGLQNSIDMDLNSPDIHYRLKTLPPAKLKFVKSKLLQIKSTANQREELKGKIAALKTQVYSPNIKNLRIAISKELVPDVLIRIGNHQKLVTEKRQTTSFYYESGNICYK